MLPDVGQDGRNSTSHILQLQNCQRNRNRYRLPEFLMMRDLKPRNFTSCLPMQKIKIKNYNVSLKKFDEYCRPKKNVIYGQAEVSTTTSTTSTTSTTTGTTNSTTTITTKGNLIVQHNPLLKSLWFWIFSPCNTCAVCIYSLNFCSICVGRLLKLSMLDNF